LELELEVEVVEKNDLELELELEVIGGQKGEHWTPGGSVLIFSEQLFFPSSSSPFSFIALLLPLAPPPLSHSFQMECANTV